MAATYLHRKVERKSNIIDVGEINNNEEPTPSRKEAEIPSLLATMSPQSGGGPSAGWKGGSSSRGRRARPKRPSQIKEQLTKLVAVKNAVMMLNELFPPPFAAQYKVVSMAGSANNPIFTISCLIHNKEFTASGRSKKEAKLLASQLALTALYGEHFTSQSFSTTSSNTSEPRPMTNLDTWLELEGKNPISILNELYPGVIFTILVAEGPSHAPQFVVRAALGSDLQLEGRGTSKKEAKLAASKALLVRLHSVKFDPLTGGLVQRASDEQEKLEIDSTGHGWADYVADAVREELEKQLEGSTYSRRKVLAGILLECRGIKSVLCFATGTKCINGEQICLAGTVLNDCHAEVIARRCLVAWLYGQLELIIEGKGESHLVPAPLGGFKLRPDASLHMFISTAPCGDARIFSMHEEVSVGAGSGVNKGKLRSKIESGMGTVPLPETAGSVQTWDGVRCGDRLLTMACSDKILRWNVLGLQGSLLSHWLEPLYISSLNLGSKYQEKHVARALYGRLGNVPERSFPPPHHLTRPQLLCTSAPESRQATNTQDFSVNWWLGSSGPEIVICSTGRTKTGGQSRLCKRSLADRSVLKGFKKFLKYFTGSGP